MPDNFKSTSCEIKVSLGCGHGGCSPGVVPPIRCRANMTHSRPWLSYMCHLRQSRPVWHIQDSQYGTYMTVKARLWLGYQVKARFYSLHDHAVAGMGAVLQLCLTQSVSNAVLQKSIPTKKRQLILYISKSKGSVDGCVGELTSARRVLEIFV